MMKRLISILLLLAASSLTVAQQGGGGGNPGGGGGGGGTPGGSNGAIQFKQNATTFGGITQWSTNGTTTMVGNTTAVLDLRLLPTANLLFPSAFSTGLLKVTTSTGAVTSVAAPTGAIVGTTDSQALTNKNLTGAGNTFPTFNQNTTGTAGGLAAAYIDWSASSGGASILNKPTGTTGTLPIWSGGTLIDSNETEAGGVFTVGAVGGMSVPTAGGGAGIILLGQGTAQALGTTAVGLEAPTAVTSYNLVFPAAASSGVFHGTNVANNIAVTLSAVTSSDIDSSVAATASPTFTGFPLAPTQSIFDNNTYLATDQFVQTALTTSNPQISVAAATAAVLPNTPAYSNGTNGIGATLTGTGTSALVVDGYTVAGNDLILVKNQASSSQNGVYKVSNPGGVASWVLTRNANYDQAVNMNWTSLIAVKNGTTNSSTAWWQTSLVNVIGTDAVSFTQFTGSGGSVVTHTGALTANNMLAGNGSGDIKLADFNGLTYTMGAITTDVNPLALTWTTNNSATTFSGLKFIVTNTAQHSGTLNYQFCGGANCFTIDPSANLNTPGSLTAGGGSSVAGTVALGGGTQASVTANSLTISTQGTSAMTGYNLNFPAAAGSGILNWTASSSQVNSAFLSSNVNGDLIAGNGSGWAKFSGNNSGTKCLSEDASGNPAWFACASVLSSLAAATGANTIANGNNPQTWNWAQTTNSQSAMTFGETSAASNGTITNALSNQSEVTISTATASTATPLSISQGSITGTVAFPALQVQSTWNNAGLTGNLIYANVTSTSSAAGSTLINLAVGNTSQFKVDKAGNITALGTLALGVDNSIAGTAQLASTAGAAHTILGSVATTSNTFNFPATVPTTGHVLDCATTSTTCVIHDSGLVTANVLQNNNPTIVQGSSLSAGAGGGEVIVGTSLTAGTLYGFGVSGLAAAEASSASTQMPAICLAISTTQCAYSGVYKFSATQSWTVGGVIYVSDGTAGTLTQTAPTTSGHFVQRVGIALAVDTILIIPSMDVGTVQ